MKRWVALGLPLLIILSLVGWRLNAKKTEEAKLKTQSKGRSGQAPVVEVATVEARSIEQSIDVVGTLESPFAIKLSPKLVGRIAMLDVREGDPVRVGQTLVRIDPSELDAQLLQQRAAISEARSRLLQAQLTAGANETGIQSSIRVQRAALESAQADLKQTEKNYDAFVGAAEATVTDATARVETAKSEVRQKQGDLASAEATQRNAKARLDRLEAQLAKGFVSQQLVDDARLAYESAQATVGVRKNEVAGANSQVGSANAVLTAAQKQLSIVKEKGQADIAAARAKVKQAEALADEANANKAQTPAYRENLKALQANVAAAEAGLRQLETRRQDLELKSTIDGTVTERLADPGSLASPGQALVTVQFLKWLYVAASVPLEESTRVFQGQPVDIRLDAIPGRVFKGTIQRINQSGDPQSRQFSIKVQLDNAKEELRPGMFARLNLVTQQFAAKAVAPIAAITKGPEGETAIVINEKDEAEIRKVKTGPSDLKGIAILEGLKPGERVVTLSYSPPKPGQKVKIGGKP